MYQSDSEAISRSSSGNSDLTPIEMAINELKSDQETFSKFENDYIPPKSTIKTT